MSEPVDFNIAVGDAALDDFFNTVELIDIPFTSIPDATYDEPEPDDL